MSQAKNDDPEARSGRAGISRIGIDRLFEGNRENNCGAEEAKPQKIEQALLLLEGLPFYKIL
jgi:hypothetical protein